MAAVHNKYNEGEGVSKDEFTKARNVHGNTPKKVEGAGNAGKGSWAAALELEETEDCAGEWKQES